MQTYIESIRSRYPQLSLHDVRLIAEGQHNIVLKVDDSLIFRFPRYEQDLLQLHTEVRILRGLQGHMPIPVPEPTYVHLDVEVGQAFMGYPLLSGEPAPLYQFETMFDAATCNRLAAQLANFLEALHERSFDIDGLLPNNARAYWSGMYARIREKLFPQIRADARKAIKAHFEDFLHNDANFNYVHLLSHGDFGPSNLLWDPQTQRFTGVLDFGGAGLQDAAVDLAAIYGINGRNAAFAQRVTAAYPKLARGLARARFYAGTFALQEALHGVENNDTEALQAGLASYV